MSVSTDIQTALVAILRGDTEVAAIYGGRVFDAVPQGPQYPFISIGSSDLIDGGDDCVDLTTEAVTLHAWHRDGGEALPAKVGMRTMRRAILSGVEPYDFSDVQITLARMIDDPDGITKHIVLTVEVTQADG